MKTELLMSRPPIVFALIVISMWSWLLLPACSKVLATDGRIREESDRARSTAEPNMPIPVRLSESYGKLPLSFEENKGQYDSRVRFLSGTGGNRLFLKSTEAVLAFRTSTPASFVRGISPEKSGCRRTAVAPEKQSVLGMTLVGANPAAKVEGLDELPGKSNYFIGSDPKKWRTGVTNYATVKYQHIYPGIDLIYHGNQAALEYDFELAPGADPAAIRIGFTGTKRIRIDRNGDLLLNVSGREIRQYKPTVYQDINGVRVQIDARFVLRGHRQAGFSMARYDAGKPLIIDPILAYSTYLGGSDSESGTGIAVDSAGNAYVTGFTRSTNFPTTPGAYHPVADGIGEVFVTKLNASGTALVYSTYLGFGESHGIAVDSSGSAYVIGSTGTTFPTTIGAFDRTYHGSGDAFVTKLSPDGSQLEYSTYLGGTGIDSGGAIAVDAGGNAYATGVTNSEGFPIVAGAFQSQLRAFHPPGCAEGDAFISKLNSIGSALVYSTFLGGSRGEGGSGIAVDSVGCAYVTGGTGSTDFPTSPNAFQPVHGTCFVDICQTCLCEDAFVTKINETGTNIVYSSFLGGSVCDDGFGIAIDPSGNAYVTGRTNSFDFPRVNPLQSIFGGGGSDAFVTKIAPTGSSIVYSTFIGGPNTDQGLGIAADAAGNAYLLGQVLALTLESEDAFVTKLSASGSSQIYFITLGGKGFESGFAGSIAVDNQGKAYVTGSTGSTDFPTTAGAVQPIFGGVTDAFVTKIDDMPPFDTCLQDDSSGSILQFNSRAGNYQFTTCQGINVAGIAAIVRRGCLITLQVNGPDRRLQASIDTCRNSGTASIQLLSQRSTFTIQDRNLANNTCVCKGN